MTGKLFVLLFLAASIVCAIPGDLIAGDPPIICEPDDNFGDPDDEFKPEDYRLIKDHSGEDTTTNENFRGIKFKSVPSDAFRLDYWIHILPGRILK